MPDIYHFTLLTMDPKTAGLSKKAKYGIDAPGVIRNLLVIGVVGAIVTVCFPLIKIGSVEIDTRSFLLSAVIFMVMGCLMLFYSLYGKFIHRDRMLNLISWTGNEQALDIGTGKGLMMVGAAKRLSTGKSTGIDIWNAEDLTGNNEANAINNARLEGVADKVMVRNENAMQMSFADESFDVVLSNLCIHNIYNNEGRNTACQEIARVLKKGGTAVISDFRHTRQYKKNFDRLGLQAKLLWPNYLSTFPPLRILIVQKA